MTHQFCDAFEDRERVRGGEEALRAERKKLQAEYLDIEQQRHGVVAERDALAAQQAQAIQGDSATGTKHMF